MKLSIAVLIVLFGAALATAQKKDPTLVRSHPKKNAATSTKSVGPGAVAAALNTKSTTASDLAKVERGTANHPNASKPATTHTTAPKNLGVGQDDKNKPMKASKRSRAGRPSSHPKTKAG